MLAAYLVGIAAATIGQTSEVTHDVAYTVELNYPARLAAKSGGGIYITEPLSDSVVEYDAVGAWTATYPVDVSPVGIAVNPTNGEVFVSGTDGRILVYDAAFTAWVTVNPALTGPNDLATYNNPVTLVDELYVADTATHQITVYAENGGTGQWEAVRGWGIEGWGPMEFEHPVAIAIDQVNDFVLVTDVDNFRVQVFDLDGIEQFRFGYRVLYVGMDATAWFARGAGLAVDSCGNYYVSDALMGTVRVFDSAGAELDLDPLPEISHVPLLGYGTGVGELRNPADILIGNGSLYVASTNNASVEVYTLVCTGGARAAATPEDTSAGRKKTRYQVRPPDNPYVIVEAMNSGTYDVKLDLNQDRQVDLADLEIAVEKFGAATVDDFLGLVSRDAPPFDGPLQAPHMIDIENTCGRCHGAEGLPGGMLTAEGQENLCLSCHTAGGLAMHEPISGVERGNSHPRGIPANSGDVPGPDPGSYTEIAFHLDGDAPSGNIRCGTCHDPMTSDAGSPYLRASIGDAELCGECHVSKGAQWGNAGHSHGDAQAFNYPIGPGREACAKCHSGLGFIDFSNGVPETDRRTDKQVHSCFVCHGVHENANEELLRVFGEVELPGGLLVNAEHNASCMACHNGRYAPGTGHLTPHYLLGGVMLEGINGEEFGNTSLTNSAHTSMVGCAECHMAPTAASGKVGAHSFNMAWHNPGSHCTGGIDDGKVCTVDADCNLALVCSIAGTPCTFNSDCPEGETCEGDGLGTCAPDDPDDGFENFENACNSIACHGSGTPLTTLNRLAWADYDNDGTTEGVQDEIQGLLDLVFTEIQTAGGNFLGHYPYWQTQKCSGGLNDGEFCSYNSDCDLTVPDDGLGTCATQPNDALLRSAIWNYEYVDNDASLGIHNTDYAGGLLQLTYEKLTGAPLAANLLYAP